MCFDTNVFDLPSCLGIFGPHLYSMGVLEILNWTLKSHL